MQSLSLSLLSSYNRFSSLLLLPLLFSYNRVSSRITASLLLFTALTTCLLLSPDKHLYDSILTGCIGDDANVAALFSDYGLSVHENSDSPDEIVFLARLTGDDGLAVGQGLVHWLIDQTSINKLGKRVLKKSTYVKEEVSLLAALLKHCGLLAEAQYIVDVIAKGEWRAMLVLIVF